MKALLSFWLVACLSLGLVACGSKTNSGDDLKPGETAALVNDKAISLEDVKKVAVNFQRQGLQPDVLDRLIEQSLVLQAAAEKGLTVTDSEVAASVSQLQVRVGGAEAFERFLAQVGATEEDITRDMRINLITQRYVDQVITPTIQIPDEEIQNYYDQNPEQFAARPEVHARHILFRTEPGADELVRSEVYGRAREVLAKAQAGEDFAGLASQHSEDETTAPRGGDLSWFGRGQMVAPFDSACFVLGAGEVSGLVETPFGVHIIKIEETRTTERKTLDEVRPSIQSVLTQTHVREGYQEAIAGLREKADLQVNAPPAEFLAEIGP
jgi:parvulin-like peptidyl-prolyl isomerase